MNQPGPGEITRLFADLRGGDDSALQRLMPLVYEQLRELAGGVFRHEAADHTLQPTALVHEVFLRLAGSDGLVVNDRQHFLRLAARAMRQLLTDHARRVKAERRGGRRDRVLLDTGISAEPADQLDLVAFDEILQRLSELNERQGRIVELRFLAGMSVDETADALGLSPRTVELDTRLARAWLRRELENYADPL